MLQAINLNKAGRNISSDEIHWRKLFRASEDSLTSTIFGLLHYLPTEMFWEIFLKSCYDCDIRINDNQITSYTFWPRWDSTNTLNANLVEPDLFISTVEFDFIIEAKRHDYNQQNAMQWKSEYIAYLNEYSELNKRVYLIALGGINSNINEKIILRDEPYSSKEITIIKCRWSRILKSVKELHSKIENNRYLLTSIYSVYNILDDIILGFRIHGYYTGEWFEKTDFIDLRDLNLARLQDIVEEGFESIKFNWEVLSNYGSVTNNNYNLLQNNHEWIHKE